MGKMYNSLSFIFGHLLGDYLFQNHKEAVAKTDTGWHGHFMCLKHCVKYATCVAVCVALLDGWKTRHINYGLAGHFIFAWMVAFVTHYPIDRFGLGWKWMKMMKQTNFMDTIKEEGAEAGWGDDTWIRVKNLRAFFVPIVYVAVDNTMHLFLMWVLFSKLGVY